MPWEPPIFKMKALEEFNRRVERLPESWPPPFYDPPMTYFNNVKSSLSSSCVPYDLFYNFEEGYNQKSARDGRRSMQSIFENIFKEEENKYVPVTSQLWYGRPWLHEKPLDWCVRNGKPSPIKDFYSRQGINISPDLEQKPAQ